MGSSILSLANHPLQRSHSSRFRRGCD